MGAVPRVWRTAGVLLLALLVPFAFIAGRLSAPVRSAGATAAPPAAPTATAPAPSPGEGVAPGPAPSTAEVGGPPAAPASGARVLQVWASGSQRSDVVSLLLSAPEIVPGWRVDVRRWVTPEALVDGWRQAPEADRPDVVVGPVQWAVNGGISGLVVPVALAAQDQAAFLPTALQAATWKGDLFAVPFQVDTTVLAWDRDRVGVRGPSTVDDIARVLRDGQAGYAAGVCVDDPGTGLEAVLTAFGGGAWPSGVGGSPDLTRTLLNTAALEENLSRYVAPGSGSAVPLVSTQCSGSPLGSQSPYSLVPLSRLTPVDNVAVGAFPAASGGRAATGWTLADGAMVTAAAREHGAEEAARFLVSQWFASADSQARMAVAGQHVPARIDAARQAGTRTAELAALVGMGTAPSWPPLMDWFAGTPWSGIVAEAWTAVTAEGTPVKTALDVAAQRALMNFAHSQEGGYAPGFPGRDPGGPSELHWMPGSSASTAPPGQDR